LQANLAFGNPPPSIQLVFSNFYLGIALGALSTAVSYTTTNTRAWPFGGDNKSTAVDEFPILTRYGSWTAHLRGAEALADRAGREIATVYRRHGPARDVSARARGEAAEWVASVKVVATDTALRVTAGIFEVTGARATGKQVGLDRFWRDVRTHTLHDPVAYKERELGRFRLLDEVISLSPSLSLSLPPSLSLSLCVCGGGEYGGGMWEPMDVWDCLADA
jgi:alkylation response protein AidB-like acyl-CoA dehydrogenase